MPDGSSVRPPVECVASGYENSSPDSERCPSVVDENNHCNVDDFLNDVSRKYASRSVPLSYHVDQSSSFFFFQLDIATVEVESEPLIDTMNEVVDHVCMGRRARSFLPSLPDFNIDLCYRASARVSRTATRL